MRSRLFAAVALAGSLFVSDARAITFTDTTLGNGSFSWTESGLTMTASTGTGALSGIGAGRFAGLWIAQDIRSSDAYTLAFSSPVSSVEIEFDAMSGVFQPTESLGSFSVSAGSLILSYVNQQFTTFDGSTIVMDFRFDNGEGIVTISSTSPFTSLSFIHAQNPQNNGTVFERVAVSVPEPGTALLLGGGLASLACAGRRSRKR